MKTILYNRILGYSERGIINSLIFSIGADKVLLKKFIELIILPSPIDIGEPDRYTILLEQSFSDFGDADLVIIVHYAKEEDKKVIFFEGKVKTFQGNWRIDYQFDKYNSTTKYDGYSSNLFFQLHLKKLLFDNMDEIRKNKGVVEPKYNVLRKIGNNGIVLDAFDLIHGSQAYYIGLIPTEYNDIVNFTKNNKNTGLHFLSWKTVHNFCQNQKLTKVLDVFKYNNGQIY